MHPIFSNSISNILTKLILPINTLIIEGRFFSQNPAQNIKMKYTVGFFMNILSLFAFTIYLEIIQLNCCGLDYNTKQNIYYRSVEEINDQILNNSIND